MEQLQLIGSFVPHRANTLMFLALKGDRWGVISAENWDTVLPFQFDHIRLEGNDLLTFSGETACRYHIKSTAAGYRAVPSAWRSTAPALPA